MVQLAKTSHVALSDRWDELFSNDWIYLQWKSHIFKGLFKTPNCCQNCSRICKQCADLQKNIYCLGIADIRGRSTTYQLFSVFITSQFFTVCTPNPHSYFSTFPTSLILILVTQDSCNSRGTPMSSPATDDVHRPSLWLSASQRFVLPLL